jgi:hypothetical protein
MPVTGLKRPNAGKDDDEIWFLILFPAFLFLIFSSQVLFLFRCLGGKSS